MLCVKRLFGIGSVSQGTCMGSLHSKAMIPKSAFLVGMLTLTVLLISNADAFGFTMGRGSAPVNPGSSIGSINGASNKAAIGIGGNQQGLNIPGSINGPITNIDLGYLDEISIDGSTGIFQQNDDKWEELIYSLLKKLGLTVVDDLFEDKDDAASKDSIESAIPLNVKTWMLFIDSRKEIAIELGDRYLLAIAAEMESIVQVCCERHNQIPLIELDAKFEERMKFILEQRAHESEESDFPDFADDF